MQVELILQNGWPECFSEMYRNYDGSEDLQTFLDTQVVWTGTPITAAEVLAEAPNYDTAMMQVVKDAKKEEINQWREDALNATVTYNTNDFDADERSRTNINGVLTSIQSGVTVADPVNWRTADNVTVQLTHVQLAELGGLMLANVQNAYDHSWDLKAQVDAAADQAAIDAIVW